MQTYKIYIHICISTVVLAHFSSVKECIFICQTIKMRRQTRTMGICPFTSPGNIKGNMNRLFPLFLCLELFFISCNKKTRNCSSTSEPIVYSLIVTRVMLHQNK